MTKKQIWIKEETKDKLRAMKVHPRETDDQLIARIIDKFKGDDYR